MWHKYYFTDYVIRILQFSWNLSQNVHFRRFCVNKHSQYKVQDGRCLGFCAPYIILQMAGPQDIFADKDVNVWFSIPKIRVWKGEGLAYYSTHLDITPTQNTVWGRRTELRLPRPEKGRGRWGAGEGPPSEAAPAPASPSWSLAGVPKEVTWGGISLGE